MRRGNVTSLNKVYLKIKVGETKFRVGEIHFKPAVRSCSLLHIVVFGIILVFSFVRIIFAVNCELQEIIVFISGIVFISVASNSVLFFVPVTLVSLCHRVASSTWIRYSMGVNCLMLPSKSAGSEIKIYVFVVSYWLLSVWAQTSDLFWRTAQLCSSDLSWGVAITRFETCCKLCLQLVSLNLDSGVDFGFRSELFSKIS